MGKRERERERERETEREREMVGVRTSTEVLKEGCNMVEQDVGLGERY